VSEGELTGQLAALRSNESALKNALAQKLDEHQQLMDVIGELQRQKAVLEGARARARLRGRGAGRRLRRGRGALV
jgi:hypothetical protein